MSAEVTHRLTMAAFLATCAVWAVASAAALRRERRVRGRLAALSAAPRGPSRRAWPWSRAASPDRPVRLVRGAGPKRWSAPCAAAVMAFVLVGGYPGAATALACACGVRLWQRRPRPPVGDGEVARGLPLAADLLAACLSAGAGPREAAEAVGECLGGPVGERLARAGAELRLGGEPAAAWGAFGAIPGARGLARCLERAAASGAPAADAVSRQAAALRAEQVRSAAARAQRAQVLITAPVGLCFLPAFLAVGVAPVVVGLASELL
ncbi:type II secretion system F family protein [Streptomyces sp. NRRL S-118]|uniref:type II secretion system F family protein n=1 Tax=Streptomyces sp. NRRL S-118 TaxID=1463881 RepID=UPI0004C616D1|nr:type II secretion system F family protein [Streptomyces sp. NRRL S-118]